ncbi:hypothetical protein Tco_1409497 [Tanacetum coccineum]|uniref:Uncharacterized protein n=1 Tax=Tanacetum coccineum TaxID=301880 RepID=A0ABQ5J6G4_9ASTR
MRNSMGGGDVLMLSSVMADDFNMKFLHLENKGGFCRIVVSPTTCERLSMDLANGSSVNLKVMDLNKTPSAQHKRIILKIRVKDYLDR